MAPPLRSNSPDIRQWFHSALESPSTFWEGPIGSAGFTLPNLEGLVWTPIEEFARSNVKVQFQSGQSNNWIVTHPDWVPEFNVIINLHHVNSCNNLIIIGRTTKLCGHLDIYGWGNAIILGEESPQQCFMMVAVWNSNQTLFWGNGSSSNHVVFELQGDGTSIIVGDDCMFATNCVVRNSDMHARMDIDAEEWLNPPGNVLIEPHVWVGQDATILKGVRVGLGSIIGAKSLVNRHVPRFSMVAGIPAQIVRTGTTWDRAAHPRAETIPSLKALEQKLRPFQRRRLVPGRPS